MAYSEPYLTTVVKILFDDAGLHVLHDFHHLIHHHIGKIKGDDRLHKTLLHRTMVEGIGGRLTIGHDESAGAEIHAAVVAHHHQEHVGEFAGVDLPQNRLARRTTGFSVVVAAEIRALCSEHIGITNVAGIVVLFAVTRHDVLHLINILHMMSKSEELTPFLGVISLAFVL